jgi:NAD(P)-dependent dehydrogenase (short-subunit alcohol dehydrogenase family)
MKIDLTGRRAIVSASSRGVGFWIALGLGNAGAEVVINGRGDEATQAAVTLARNRVPGGKFVGISGDLATADGVASFIERAGDADIIVNNLGVYEDKPFGEITDAEWMRYFETNVMSGVRLARHYLPRMIEKNWGRIQFISSESAITTPPARIHYGTTKTAQLALARGLAEMTAGTQVTVNSIIVGITRTEPVEAMITKLALENNVSEAVIDRQIAEKHRPTQLLKRLATSEEVANMVVYIASPQAAATNGAALRVEGGGIRSIT